MADTNNSAKINIAVDLIPGDTKELAKVVNTFKNELTSGADLSKYFKYLTKSYTKAIGSLSKPQSTVDKYINGVAIKTAYENMQKINDLRTAAGNKPFEMPEMDFKISGSQIKDIANLTSVLEKMGRTLSKAKTEIDSFSGSIPEMMLSITKAEISRVKKDLKKKSDSDQRELENLLKSGNADKQVMTDALNRYIDSYSQFEALKSGLQGTVKIPKSKYFDELISKASQFGMSSKDMTALLSKAISPDNIGVIQKDLSTMLNNAYRNVDLNYSKIISDSMQSANEKNIEKELSSYIDYINNNIENLRGIKQSIRVDDKTSKKDKITRYQAVIDEAINIAELESLVKSTGAKNINTTKLSASTKAEIDDISQETNMIFDISDELNSVDFSNFTQLDNKSAEELLAIYSQIEDVIKNIQRYNILANGEYGTTFSLESGNDLTIAELMEKQSKIKELAMSQGVEITSFGENVEIAQRILDNAVRIADGRSLNFFSALAQNIPDISGAIDDETAEVNKSGEELREAVNNANEAGNTLSGNASNSSVPPVTDEGNLNVNSAANNTAQSFNDKTDAINNEAIAMENAAQRETKALDDIKQKVVELKEAIAGIGRLPSITDNTQPQGGSEQPSDTPLDLPATDETTAANKLAEEIENVKSASAEMAQAIANLSDKSIFDIGNIKAKVDELSSSIQNVPPLNIKIPDNDTENISLQISAIREKLINALNGEQSVPLSFIPDIKSLKQQIAEEVKNVPIEITNNNIKQSFSIKKLNISSEGLTDLKNSIKSKLTDVEIQSFKIDSAVDKMKKDLKAALKTVDLKFDTHRLQQDIRTAAYSGAAQAEQSGLRERTITQSLNDSSNKSVSSILKQYAAFEKSLTKYYNENTKIYEDEELNKVFRNLFNRVKNGNKDSDTLNTLYRQFYDAQTKAINRGLSVNADKELVDKSKIAEEYERLIAKIRSFITENNKISQISEDSEAYYLKGEFDSLLAALSKNPEQRSAVDIKQISAAFARYKNEANEFNLLGNIERETKALNDLDTRYISLADKAKEFRDKNNKISNNVELYERLNTVIDNITSSTSHSEVELSKLNKEFISIQSKAKDLDLIGNTDRETTALNNLVTKYISLAEYARKFKDENDKIGGNIELFEQLNNVINRLALSSNHSELEFSELKKEFAAIQSKAGELNLLGNTADEVTTLNELDTKYLNLSNDVKQFIEKNDKIKNNVELYNAFNAIIEKISSSANHSKVELSEYRKEFSNLKEQANDLHLLGNTDKEIISLNELNENYRRLADKAKDFRDINDKISSDSQLYERLNAIIAKITSSVHHSKVELSNFESEFNAIKSKANDLNLLGNTEKERAELEILKGQYSKLATEMLKFKAKNNKFTVDSGYSQAFDDLYDEISNSTEYSKEKLNELLSKFRQFQHEITAKGFNGNVLQQDFFSNLSTYNIDSLAEFAQKNIKDVKSKLLSGKYGFLDDIMRQQIDRSIAEQTSYLESLSSANTISDNDIKNIIEKNSELNELIATYQEYSKIMDSLEKAYDNGNHSVTGIWEQGTDFLSADNIGSIKDLKKWISDSNIFLNDLDRNVQSNDRNKNAYEKIHNDIKRAKDEAVKLTQIQPELSDDLKSRLSSIIEELEQVSPVDITSDENLQSWISGSTDILNNWISIKEQITNSLKLAGRYGDAVVSSTSNTKYASKAKSLLDSTGRRYSNILNDQQLNTFNARLNEIQTHILQVNDNAQNFTAQTVDNIENEIRELDNFGRTMADVNNLEKALTNLSNLRNKLTARNFTGSLVDGQNDSWQNQFNSMEREIRDVISSSSNAAPGSLDTLQNDLNRVRESYESLSAAANRGITFSNSSTSVANLNAKFEDLINKMLRFKETNSRISRDSGLSNELDTLISQAQTLGRTPLNLKQVTAQFNSLKNTVMSRGLSGRSLGDEISYIAEKIGLKAVLGGTVYKIIDYLKQMVSVVKELDTGMTTLKRVSTATAEEYSTFFKDAAQSAHDMGSGIKDVVDAAGEFSKLGYSLEEASSLGKSAVTYANVGFMDTASAIESMSSVIQGFKVDAEDAIRVVDRMNIVGNKFAISSKGIGDGLQRAASSLVAAGNDIDESIALITAGNTVLQDPESVANGLKVIGMRLRGAKTELERESEETDGMIESTSKLQDKIKSMTGVDIMSDNDTFKSTYDILLEIANVWEDISDIDQAALLELLAGKNRANVLAAILQSPDVLKSVYDTSVNSAGSAERELETYLDSIEGRMSQLKATFQKLSSDVVSSELIKKVVTIADTALQTVDGLMTLGGTFGKIFTGDNDKWAERFDQVKALPTILGAISAAVSVKNGGKADGLLGINYALCLSN